MLDQFETHPDYRDLLQSAGLTDFERVMQCRDGELVGQHARRDVTRLEIIHESRRCCLFLKRERSASWKDLFSGLVCGWGWTTKARWEWQAIRRLQAAGFGCAEPVAFGQRGLFSPRGFLALAEIPDAVVLTEALAGASARDRRELIAALAREVARLHDAGFDHPDLYSKHVWVSRQAEGWRVFLLDFQRTRRRWFVGWKRRLNDLAALNSTLDPNQATLAERMRFLRIYLEATGRQGRQRRAARRILHRTNRLISRPVTLRRRAAAQTRKPGGPHMVPSSDGRMWFDAAHGEHFRRRGLDDFDAVMEATSGTLMRRLPHRENWRLPWTDAERGRQRAAYLKLHRVRSAENRLRAWFNRPPRPSPGVIEAKYILDLERAGVATMPLLAYGEKLSRRGLQESFLLTEEVFDAVPLDTFLRRRFPGGPEVAERDPCLHRLVKKVAEVARHFHALGYNHRDFYCCHFLIREPTPGEFTVNLIDLQRVQHRNYWRGRWIVKDLAQLSYSSPPEVIGPRLRLVFLKRYLGVSRLRPQDKRLVRRVLAKHRWITCHGYPP
jgi:heptose I phosphotransferase